jgi:foldase protein PrsA
MRTGIFRLFLLCIMLSWALAACGEENNAGTATGLQPTRPAVSPTPLVNRKLGYAPDSKPVARVDGVDITADDFNKAVDEARATAEEQAGTSLNWNEAENAELLKNIRLQSLEGLINFQVVAAAATKEGVTANQDSVARNLDDFKKQLGTPENYRDWLARRFMSEDDLKKRIGQAAIFEEMSQRHSNVEEKGEQAQVRHILVATEAEARQLYTRLQQGANFADVARQFSLDTASAQKGGDLGWIFRGQTDPPFESAAFALAPNAVSGPVKTEKGFHLIQLIAREVRPLPFDLVQQRKTEQFGNYIKSLRDKAKIERLLAL